MQRREKQGTCGRTADLHEGLEEVRELDQRVLLNQQRRGRHDELRKPEDAERAQRTAHSEPLEIMAAPRRV
jgi:hypothetical protein